MNSFNIDLAKDIYLAFGLGDLKTILSFLADDISWTYLGPKEIPMAGNYQGKQQVQNFFTALVTNQEAIDFQIHKYFGEDDHVVVLGEEKMRIKPTGKIYQSPWVHIFVFKDKKVIKFTEISNQDAILSAYRR